MRHVEPSIIRAQGGRVMPEELWKLFVEADTVLFKLHREMQERMAETEGKENWREVYAMRFKLLGQIAPMCRNNFPEAKP